MEAAGHLTHVRLLVDAYEETFRFYRDALGLEPTFGDAGSGYADFDTGDVTLALFDAAEMADALDDGVAADRDRSGAATGPGRDDVALVLAADDVDETAAGLEADGVHLAAPPTDHPEWGIRTVHCRDPDGNVVEFNEPLE